MFISILGSRYILQVPKENNETGGVSEVIPQKKGKEYQEDTGENKKRSQLI